MALFDTNWHYLGGRLSRKAKPENELGKTKFKAGTLGEKCGNQDDYEHAGRTLDIRPSHDPIAHMIVFVLCLQGRQLRRLFREPDQTRLVPDHCDRHQRTLWHSDNGIGDLASAQSRVDPVQRCQRYQRWQGRCVCHLCSYCSHGGDSSPTFVRILTVAAALWILRTTSIRREGSCSKPNEPLLAAPSRPVNSGSRGSGSYGFLPLPCLMATRVSGRSSRWCFLPDSKRGPRGIDLVIGDLLFRVFPAWY